MPVVVARTAPTLGLAEPPLRSSGPTLMSSPSGNRGQAGWRMLEGGLDHITPALGTKRNLARGRATLGTKAHDSPDVMSNIRLKRFQCQGS